jgi:hypothetical protein
MRVTLEHGVELVGEKQGGGGGLLGSLLQHLGLARLLGLGPQEPPAPEPEEEAAPAPQEEAFRRYRPLALHHLCRETGFTAAEMKRLYRGFKTECPTGVLSEEGFHNIYSGFFPWGEEPYTPGICSYSHYLFSLMDRAGAGCLTFGVGYF